jgi:hypothetical protein
VNLKEVDMIVLKKEIARKIIKRMSLYPKRKDLKARKRRIKRVEKEVEAVSIEREVIINIGIVERDIEEGIIRKKAEAKNKNIGKIFIMVLTITIEEEIQVKIPVLHPLATLQSLLQNHLQMKKGSREKERTRRK